jgi:hypothetical protein
LRQIRRHLGDSCRKFAEIDSNFAVNVDAQIRENAATLPVYEQFKAALRYMAEHKPLNWRVSSEVGCRFA